MNFDPHYSPRQPEPSFDHVSSRAGAYLQRVEMGFRSRDEGVFNQIARDIILYRDAFALSVPRVIELLADPDPRVVMRASRVLLDRPHWIGEEPLNDQLLPYLCREMSSQDRFIPEALFFGLTPGAVDVRDPEVQRFFTMATASVVFAPGPHLEVATLALFGERIPPRSLSRVLLAVAEVVDWMAQTLALDAECVPPNFRGLAQISSAAATGIFLMRHHIRERFDRRAAADSTEMVLVSCMEQHVAAMAHRAEQGMLPDTVPHYQLLLTYALVMGDLADRQTSICLEQIGRSLQGAAPQVAECLLRMRDPELPAPALIVSDDVEGRDGNQTLKLIADLMLITREYEQSLHRLSRDAGESRQSRLAYLQEFNRDALISPLVCECFQAISRKIL